VDVNGLDALPANELHAQTVHDLNFEWMRHNRVR
jgi:hypothetical protein